MWEISLELLSLLKCQKIFTFVLFWTIFFLVSIETAETFLWNCNDTLVESESDFQCFYPQDSETHWTLGHMPKHWLVLTPIGKILRRQFETFPNSFDSSLMCLKTFVSCLCSLANWNNILERNFNPWSCDRIFVNLDDGNLHFWVSFPSSCGWDLTRHLQVVLTTTNTAELCINGMSFSRRASRWANAALVVTVSSKDFESLNFHGPLAGVEFQVVLVFYTSSLLLFRDLLQISMRLLVGHSPMQQ